MSERETCRKLLRLLLVEFRRRNGAEIEEAALALLAESRGLGRILVWIRLVADACRFALSERRKRWRERHRPRRQHSLKGDQTLKDIALAWRVLWRSRSTPALVVTLGLGMGAASAMFSVLDGVLLKPLPYLEPDRLVTVWRFPKTSFSPADYLDVAEMNQVFASITAYSGDNFDLVHAGGSRNEFLAHVRPRLSST